MDSNAVGPPLVLEVQVADAPDAWTRAGFTVVDGCATVGDVRFRLVGDRAGAHGIVGWMLSGVTVTAGLLDGLATTVEDAAPVAGDGPPAVHPNGVTGLDHIVVSTPDLTRTIEALAHAGVELRRIRETESYGAPMRQAFFRFGPTVIEVVSGDRDSGQSSAEAPATWFGLAFDVHDLGATAALLGEGLGKIRTAVQPGRRIATLRHKQLGMSVAVAAMDDHPDR
jgi:hypothetical protein